jgi:hypothetical protein
MKIFESIDNRDVITYNAMSKNRFLFVLIIILFFKLMPMDLIEWV